MPMSEHINFFTTKALNTMLSLCGFHVLAVQEHEERSIEALEELINQNNGLIWSIVRRFLGRGYELEDLYQIGCIGFIKSVKRFDMNFDYKMSTFAVPYIMGEIKKFIRDDRNDKSKQKHKRT